MIILNANTIPLNLNSGTLPDVSGALLNYFQPIIFETVVKTVVNFQVVETPTVYNFQGVWQPFTPEQLLIKPEGQRSWKWFTLHAQPSLVLNTDDVIKYNSVQYRVMSKMDWSLYGYLQYEIIEDFSGAGP